MIVVDVVEFDENGLVPTQEEVRSIRYSDFSEYAEVEEQSRRISLTRKEGL